MSVPAQEWFEIKGRLFRFFGKQAGWKRWPSTEPRGWTCGPASSEGKTPAPASRVSALLDKPQLIGSRAMPKSHAFQTLDSTAWDRLLHGIFVYLDGPVHLDSLTSIVAGIFSIGTPSGAPPGAGHITVEQMDAWVEESLEPEKRDAVGRHIGECDLCARQLRAYEAAAPVMSEPARHAKTHRTVHPGDPSMPTPVHSPRNAQSGFSKRVGSFFKSPQLVIMTALGVALAIGVPYMAWRSLPDTGNDPNARPDVPLDTSILASMPQTLAAPIQILLDAEEPVLPDILQIVPPPTGIAQVYPVMESVESIQPAVTWQPLEDPPYSVEIRDDVERTLARTQGLTTTSWVVPVQLQRGRVYTWRITSGNGIYEDASFLVLDEDSLALWQSIRSQYSESDLVMGGAAQYLGMLTAAEREFGELLEKNPDSMQAARLLDNVLALRDQQ